MWTLELLEGVLEEKERLSKQVLFFIFGGGRHDKAKERSAQSLKDLYIEG